MKFSYFCLIILNDMADDLLSDQQNWGKESVAEPCSQQFGTSTSLLNLSLFRGT